MTAIVHVLVTYDGASEEVVEIAKLEGFNLELFQQQFDVDPVADPKMHDRYSVGPSDIEFLKEQCGITTPFDFRQFAYFIEAVRDGSE